MEQDLLQEWKQRHFPPALESQCLPPLSLPSFEDQRTLQVRLNFIPKIKVREQRMYGMALAEAMAKPYISVPSLLPSAII